MATLTAEELKSYRRDGYLLFHRPLLPSDEFDRLNAIFEDQLARKVPSLPDELDTPHFREPQLLQFLLHPTVLDLIEPITGPDIALWSSHFICKEPYTGPATPWHEDSAFWEGRVDNYENIVTVWLALDRSSRQNGCMRVVPGSHRNGFSQYHEVDRASNTFAREIVRVDDSTAVDLELWPDECSLHDARIIHGAAANTSPHRRCGYTMRYMPATTLMVSDKNPGHKLWLARGRPRAASRYENA